MLIFEITATLATLAVMLGISYTMVGMMNWLDKVGWKFIPAAWLTTAWGIGTFLGGSMFIIDILKMMFQ